MTRTAACSVVILACALLARVFAEDEARVGEEKPTPVDPVLSKKIKAWLGARDLQAVPLYDGGMSEEEYFKGMAEQLAEESELLKAPPEAIVAASAALMNSELDKHRLMILLSRTGIKQAEPLIQSCFDGINIGRQMLAMRTIKERMDERTIPAQIYFMHKGDFRVRELVNDSLSEMAAKKPELGVVIGAAALEYLQRESVWTRELNEETPHLSGVISLLHRWHVPLTALTLLRRYPQATPPERDAMIYVASAIKDEPSLQMVRILFADMRTKTCGLNAACLAAGEMGDLQSVPALLSLLTARDPRLAKDAYTGLCAISQESFAANSQPWNAWWDTVIAMANDPARTLSTAQEDKDKKSRLQAMRILSLLQLPGAQAALLRGIQDSDTDVRAEAVRGFARLARAEDLNVFIKLLRDESRVVAAEALKALQFRTEQSLPGDPAAWTRWLAEITFQSGALQDLMKRTAPVANFRLPKPRVKDAPAVAASALPSPVESPPAPVASAETQVAAAAPLPEEEEESGLSGLILLGVVASAGVGLVLFLFAQSKKDAARRAQLRHRAGAADAQIAAINRRLERR